MTRPLSLLCAGIFALLITTSAWGQVVIGPGFPAAGVNIGAQKGSQLAFRFQNGAFASTGGNGQTVSVLTNLEAPPVWVRLVHFNDQTGATWSVGGAAVSPTSGTGLHADDAYNPYDATGVRNDNLWVPVTYNNACSNVDQFSQTSGSTATATVPVAPVAAGQPAVCYSDWMQVQPVVRIDGGFGALLLTRVYSATLVRYQGGNSYSSNVNRISKGNWSTGNFTAGTWPMTGVSTFNFASPGVQYVIAGKGITISLVGDSILNGNTTTGGYSSFGQIAAAALSTTALPVQAYSEAFSGRTSADFLQNGYNHIKNNKPQVVVIQTFSGNNTRSQAAALVAFNQAMALAQYAIANNAFPILTTEPPVFCGDATDEAYRTYANGLVRGAGTQGYAVIDLDIILGTGANPNCYQAQYTSDGGTHPNDAGHAAIAAVLQPLMTKYAIPH